MCSQWKVRVLISDHILVSVFAVGELKRRALERYNTAKVRHPYIFTMTLQFPCQGIVQSCPFFAAG